MDKINNTKELDLAILYLTNKQAEEELLLKNEFKTSYESLKPINILKSTFKELVEAPNFKEDLLNTSISIASGYLSKKLAVGSSNDPLKQIFGSFLQIGITSLVVKNADGIKSKLVDFLSKVFEKK